MQCSAVSLRYFILFVRNKIVVNTGYTMLKILLFIDGKKELANSTKRALMLMVMMNLTHGMNTWKK